MGLFGKKNGVDLKTLSEKEIQQKLYGHLRSASGPIHDESPRAKAAQPAAEVSQSKILSPQENRIPSAHLPLDPRAGSSSVNSSKSKAETTSDLFKISIPSEAPLKQKGILHPEDNSQTRIEQANKPQSFFKAPQKKISIPIVPILKIVGAAVWTVLGKIGEILLAGVSEIFKMLLRLFFALDLKKPQIRRAAFWGGAVVVLALIFAGIHSLNIKREVAMKHPARHVVHPPKPAHHSHFFNRHEAEKQPAKKEPLQQESDSAAAKTKTQASVSSSQTPAETPLQAPTEEGDSSEEAASATAAQTPAVKTEARETSGVYVIQIATFAGREDAESLVTRLKAQNLESFVKPLVRPGGKTYYCAFLGRFKTYQDAENKLSEFKKKDISKSFQDSFIRSL